MNTEPAPLAESDTVIVVSDSADPVAIRASRSKSGVIHVDELCDFMTVQPWPEMLRIEVPDFFNDAVRGARVINRIFSLHGTKVAAMLRAEKVDVRWFHIRIRPWLDLAACLAHDTGTRGVSRTLLPLDAQWFEIKRGAPEVLTPDFIRSRGWERPDLSRLDNPFQKSVWSLFDWKMERAMTREEKESSQFHVSKPRGVPLIPWYLGRSAQGVYFPGKQVDVDHAAIRRIVSVARKVFRSDAGEMLLFAEGASLRFHAFSPLLATIAAFVDVTREIDEWICCGHQGELRVPL